MPIGTISTTFNGKDVDVEWRIDGFTSLPEEDRACYLSPVFSFRNQEWYLVIYPNGWSERDSSGYVDLQLCKYYSSPSIEQEFSLSFKTVNGEKYLEEHSTRVFEEGNIGHTFLRFLSRSELLKRQSKLVSCDVLTVICTMKNPTSVRSASKSLYV